MRRYWPLVAVAALSLACVDAAWATAKHRHHAYVAPAPVSSYAPARMIEVRPGVIISSYDRITDEGYGRWRRCSDGKK
jgi:hypothetical protein